MLIMGEVLRQKSTADKQSTISQKTRDSLIELAESWPELLIEKQIEELHKIRQMEMGASDNVFMRCVAVILYPKSSIIDARSAVKMLLDSHRHIVGVLPLTEHITKPVNNKNLVETKAKPESEPGPTPKPKKRGIKAKITPNKPNKPKAKMTAKKVRADVMRKLDFDKDYMVDKKSGFAKDCQGAENVKLRIMPFEADGYDKYLAIYGKSAEHILFYEVDNPRKVYPLHYKSIKPYNGREAGEVKWNGF